MCIFLEKSLINSDKQKIVAKPEIAFFFRFAATIEYRVRDLRFRNIFFLLLYDASPIRVYVDIAMNSLYILRDLN